MQIRAAKLEELDDIMTIFDSARSFMRENGNHVQWIGGYPSAELIENDIKTEHLYVCEDGTELVAAFWWGKGPDATYALIEDGAWLNDEPYDVIHRLAVGQRGRGIGRYCLLWAQEKSDNIRVDTHISNVPMQKLLESMGYVACGTIHIADGTPRIGYQRYV